MKWNRRRAWTGALTLAALLLGACRQTKELAQEVALHALPSTTVGKPAIVTPTQRERLDLLKSLNLCEVRHRGLFIDFTSEQADVYRSLGALRSPEVRLVRRAGVQTSEVLTRAVPVEVWLDKAAQNVALSLRAAAGSASEVVAFIDGKRVGGAKLAPGTGSVLYLGSVADELPLGRHVIELRFNGKGPQPGEVKASLDWLRVHFADDRDERYLAPILDNLLLDAAIGDKPRRSLALRAPGSVRCPLAPALGSRVRVEVGYWGEGSGVARIDARGSDGSVVTLAEQRVKGGEGAEWQTLDLTLDAFAGNVIALDFVASESGSAGRVLFGEPRVERDVDVAVAPRASYVVVVVAGGLERGLVPPWGQRELMPTLFRVAEQGIVFEGYRATSATVNGAMASLLTAKLPAQHGVLDGTTRLGSQLPVLGEAVRKHHGAAAFFSNVPYSFEPFGFDRGWDKLATYSPVDDRPGTEPLIHAADWVASELGEEREGPRLLVVHLSAAHPPWDVTQDEAKILPPEEYAGVIEPRKAAASLREVRHRDRSSRRLLGPNDWVRVEALQKVALRKVDTALAGLVRKLEDAQIWDQSLFVFLGDVGMGERTGVPFDPHGSLDEARLMVPLVVKFPADANLRGSERHLVGTAAVGQLLATSLGVASELGVPEVSRRSLGGGQELVEAPLVAREGQKFAIHLGRYRVIGGSDGGVRLCDVETDPACGFDLAAEHPYVLQWILRLARPELTFQPGEPVYAEPDTRTSNALRVYGL
jgi:hypothetical protein